MHCKIFSSIRGLYPLGASSNPLVMAIPVVCRHCHVSPEQGQNHLLLATWVKGILGGAEVPFSLGLWGSHGTMGMRAASTEPDQVSISRTWIATHSWSSVKWRYFLKITVEKHFQKKINLDCVVLHSYSILANTVFEFKQQ